MLAGRPAQGAPWLLLDPSTIGGRGQPTWSAGWTGAASRSSSFWCPTDIGVPTFTCFIVDRHPGAGAYRGYGCHLDPEIAMVRAVTEAVQARTIFIAGARDDLMRSTYAVLKRSRLSPADFRQHGRGRLGHAGPGHRHLPRRHPRHARALAAAGFEHVLARELDAREFEVAVARVIVPGLEPYLFQWVAAGDRARRFDPDVFVS